MAFRGETILVGVHLDHVLEVKAYPVQEGFFAGLFYLDQEGFFARLFYLDQELSGGDGVPLPSA